MRQKILNYITERHSTTVDELSRIFRVTPANIRHHLSILVQQGSVKPIGQKTSLRKGRPVIVYTSRQYSDRDNLDHLSAALLSIFIFNANPVKKELLIDELAQKISSDLQNSSSNPTRRLYTAIQSLNKLNYQAHWEAHIDHPRIMIGRCPYSSILEAHPELCQLDAAILENLLRAPVWQIEKQVMDARNLPRCVFVVNQTH